MAIIRSEIKNDKKKFIHHLDFYNSGPLELKASVLPLSYADPQL